MEQNLRISADEIARLRALMREFGLQGAEALLLEQAMPIVSIGLLDITTRDERRPLHEMPIGASRFGGPPDVPRAFDWPRLASGAPMHFYLQLDLASAPEIGAWPLPSSGWLYVFIGIPPQTYDLYAQIIHVDAPLADLQRTAPPAADAPDHDYAEYFPVEFEPFLLRTSPGVDFDMELSGPRDLLEALEEKLAPADGTDLINRFFEFAARARDVRHAELADSGYPLFWWHVGQLLGPSRSEHRTESAARFMAGNRERDVGTLDVEERNWHRILSMESNALIGFETLSDARPYHVLVRAIGPTWQRFEFTDVHVAG